MADDVSIVVRVRDATRAGITSVNNSLTRLTNSANQMDKSFGSVKGSAISLAPALIPIAAATAPIVAGLGAATVALGAFGAAIGGQVAAMGDASEAEKKYTEAVKEHGKSSKEAAQAEKAYLASVQKMPPATREAAAALSVMKEQYKQWSDSLASDTMPVVTKGMANLGALFPKLTPMVKGAAGELDRFMTIVAGGIESGPFDQFMQSFAEFSTGALKKANDGLIRLMMTMDSGKMSGGLAEFMQYAKENGPLVGETLKNLGQALAHLVAAASETGVGLLSVINAFASLVNAVPTEVLSTLLQLVLVFKAVKMAAAGFAVVATALGAFRAQLVAAGTAAAGASGTFAALGAAFMALSRTAKVAVAGTGIGLLVIALTELSQIGEDAPVNVDKLTTSLGELGRTGKATGLVAEEFGKDFEKLSEQIGKVVDPSVAESFNNWGHDVTGGLLKAGVATEEFTKSVDSIDEGLANLVAGGKADLAKAALENMLKSMSPEKAEKLKEGLDGYKDKLAALKFEQEHAAAAMGLFGSQAMAVQQKLDAQKTSADGLAQSINALSDAALTARGSLRGMEAAMDAADKALKDNGATLDEGTEKGRANNQALDDLATATKKAAEAARANGASWAEVNGIYDRGREKLISVADQMGLTKSEAKALADQILRTPDKTARLKGNMEDLQAKLNSAKKQLKNVPDSRKARVAANIDALNYSLAKARDALNALDGKVATTYVVTQHSSSGGSGLKGLAYAEGGVVRGPGTDTSDSVPIMASNDEFIVNAKSSRKHRRLLEAINKDQMLRFAKGGRVSKAEREARSGARGDLTISHFGRIAGAQRSEFASALSNASSVGALAGALNQWRSIILKATHGGTERSLLRQLDSTGRALLKHEKSLGKVTDQLDKAKSKLSDLKNSASQLAASVKSNILGSADITKGAGGDRVMTASGIMGGLIGSRDKAQAFAQALKDLKARGLSKDLLSQVAEAGIDGGGLETATALLSASGSEIRTMNDLQAQISKAAGAAGKTTADAMYAAQIKAQEKLVKDLKSEQSKLTKAMDKLTKAMEKAIEKAFFGKASGGIVGAASGGVRGGLTWVGEHGPELVRMPAGSHVYPAGGSRRMWDSMLNTGPGGGGGGVRVVLEIHSSGSPEDEYLLQRLRRSIRVRGGDVQVVLGNKR